MIAGFVMRRKHLALLVCPQTKRPLVLNNIEDGEDGAIRSGLLFEPLSGNKYPIVNHIPRFVAKENYAQSFGFQWNIYKRTQSDEYSGVDVSRNRFQDETKWPADLNGQLLLEIGCGAGRFTKHALDTRATVVSLDFSDSVEANYELNGQHENLLLIQADIFSMPFKENYFDKAFCFGVLQHTPNPKVAFLKIVKTLKPGGKLASDIYWKSIRRFLHLKYWARPFTNRYDVETLHRHVTAYVDLMWPVVRIMRRTKLGQKFISRFIAERSDCLLSADDCMLKEWAYLDTFDWFSPSYDKPQTLRTFESWHKDNGLTEIEVRRGFNGLEGRGTKPQDG